jgi:hypothetical protein
MFNINNLYWKILFVAPSHHELRRTDGSYALGMCDVSTKTIYISNALNKQMVKKVLTHEITHAAMFSYGVELTYEQEELISDLIATYGNEIIQTTNKIFKRIQKKWGT